MRFSLLATAALTVAGISACSQDVVRPEESVTIKLSEEVARGQAPCKMQVFSDGKVVFTLDSKTAKCPLPHYEVLNPEVLVNPPVVTPGRFVDPVTGPVDADVDTQEDAE